MTDSSELTWGRSDGRPVIMGKLTPDGSAPDGSALIWDNRELISPGKPEGRPTPVGRALTWDKRLLRSDRPETGNPETPGTSLVGIMPVGRALT
jgi:hypothetical protein